MDIYTSTRVEVVAYVFAAVKLTDTNMFIDARRSARVEILLLWAICVLLADLVVCVLRQKVDSWSKVLTG